jgi:uncharacterized iron-regulated membrane protein
MKASVLNRKLHRWGAILTAVPLLVIIGSGILLQLKKEWGWIQPPTRRGEGTYPTISFERILEAARSSPGAGISSWNDIDRLDVRCDRGIVKVQGKSQHEVQVDTVTGEVLQVAYRRSDLIESIHDGTFFADWAKLGVFLPAGAILLGLWGTGVYLWLLPHLARRKRKRAQTA